MNQLAKDQGGRDYRMNDLSFSHLNGETVQDDDSADDNTSPDAPVTENDIIYDAIPEQGLSRFELQQRADDQIAGAVPVTDSEVATETVEIEQPTDTDEHDNMEGAADDYFDDSPTNAAPELDSIGIQPIQPTLRKSERSTSRHDYKRANASGFVNSTAETSIISTDTVDPCEMEDGW